MVCHSLRRGNEAEVFLVGAWVPYYLGRHLPALLVGCVEDTMSRDFLKKKTKVLAEEYKTCEGLDESWQASVTNRLGVQCLQSTHYRENVEENHSWLTCETSVSDGISCYLNRLINIRASSPLREPPSHGYGLGPQQQQQQHCRLVLRPHVVTH